MKSLPEAPWVRGHRVRQKRVRAGGIRTVENALRSGIPGDGNVVFQTPSIEKYLNQPGNVLVSEIIRSSVTIVKLVGFIGNLRTSLHLVTRGTISMGDHPTRWIRRAQPRSIVEMSAGKRSFAALNLEGRVASNVRRCGRNAASEVHWKNLIRTDVLYHAGAGASFHWNVR